jgi:hypothetical protein
LTGALVVGSATAGTAEGGTVVAGGELIGAGTQAGVIGILLGVMLSIPGDSAVSNTTTRDTSAIIINRIGGGSPSNLALKPQEFNANPPGISVIGGVPPQVAADEMRAAYPNASRINAASMVTGTTTLAQVWSAGFIAFPSPSAALPNHWTLTSPAGVAGFNPVSLVLLSTKFINVPTPPMKLPTQP